MTTHSDRTAGIDRDADPEPPRESVVCTVVEDGVVVYDEENPDAWITSTVSVDTTDVC
jgi:hypothetical protein